MSSELGPIAVTVRVTQEGDIGEITTDLEQLGRTSEQTTLSARRFTDVLATTGRTVSAGIIVWDRFSIAQNAVENAQLRQIMAQDRLNFVMEKYGAGSREAILAQQQLEISSRGVEIAQQRMWVRITFGTLVVLPEMLQGMSKLINMTRGLTVATVAETIAQTNLARARLFAVGAATFGIGALVGFAVSQTVATQVPQPNMNVYGDINIEGAGDLTNIAGRVARQVTPQQMRAGRP